MVSFEISVLCSSTQMPFPYFLLEGHIAKLIGMPRHSRHVGQGVPFPLLIHSQILIVNDAALKFLQPGNDVPWQRVISSSGKISSRGPATEGARIQKDVLEAEGVEVTTNEMGEFRISWAQYGWFPASVDLEMNTHVQPQNNGGQVAEAVDEADE